MKIKSPLSDINEVIRQLIASADQYQDFLKKNESATRAVLIDPIIRALGWDIANPYMVEVERTFNNTRVDYALLDINSDVKVIIEAKPLGSDIENKKRLLQIISYALTYGIKDVVISNGIRWIHYSGFSSENVKPLKIIDLKTEDLVSCSAYLVQNFDAAKYWPEDEDIESLAQQITQLSNDLTNVQHEVDQLKTNFDTKSLIPSEKSKDVFISLDSIPNLTGKKPSIFRLPNGQKIKVNSWKNILIEACKFTMRNNPDLKLPIKDSRGKSIDLIGFIRPRKGLSYVEMQYQDNIVFIYSNYDSNNCVLNAEYILGLSSSKDLSMTSIKI
jgi:predicted type IV restriction endonuclease